MAPPERLLRLSPSAAVKEKRLQALLAGRSADDPRLVGIMEDAQILGSLELAGLTVSWREVREERAGAPGPAAVRGLRSALAAVAPEAPVDVAALRAWHGGVLPGAPGFRTAPREREGAPPGAPPEFIEARLAVLADWMGADSGRELKPLQQASLALARIVEILPFEDGNGRVSRLAASHLMRRGGLRPPILVRGDGPRLVACLGAAFRLELEPLEALLEEASERAVDVLIQAIAIEAGESWS
jgi:Fic/DOC family